MATITGEGESPRERLARLMDDRRTELNLRWLDVADRAELTLEGLRGVRFGAGTMRSLTKAAIERALEWEPGTVEKIMRSPGHIPLPKGASQDNSTPSERQPTPTVDTGEAAGLDAIMRIVEARNAEIAAMVQQATEQQRRQNEELSEKLDRQSEEIAELRKRLEAG